MRRALPRLVASALLLAAGACEFLPRGPLDGLEAPAPLPQPETSWLDLGRRLLAADRPAEAGQAFLRSLREEGMTAAALTGAGVAAERQGMLAEALRHFEAARLRAPGSPTAHLNLGAVLYRMGELHAARRAFQTALALSGGTDAFAARNLAMSEAAIVRAEAAALDRSAAEAPLRIERIGPARFRLIEASDTRGNG
ncbi:MAG TPA: tetratricopeptide repeat protein [Alphaproteobacteria bacterium]